MTPALPAFCTPLESAWPFATPLPGIALRGCRFDPARLAEQDFARCAIVAPANIQRSVAKRRGEYLAGRLCARAALLALTGRGEVPATGEDRAPIWPAGVSGSITHGAGWAMALVARKGDWRGLGLDMEQRLEPERALRLAEEILTPAELQRLALLPAEAQAERVTLTFSLKESLFKALYPLVGKRFYFHDAELLSVDNTAQTARLALLIDLAGEWVTGCELEGHFQLYDDRLLSLVAVR